MKTTEIIAGRTYHNAGARRTRRKVIAISMDHRPRWLGSPENEPNEPGVLFKDKHGKQFTLYLSSFARWAGGEDLANA